MIGKTLAHYEILEPLGQGGMGEVYRARDTRLGRDVAVKVLRRGLAGNAEVNSRFQREAKTISSLNHPNICVLHDVGREGDTSFLVMELVEGETLAQRLGKGPLKPAEVIRYGAQIADALDRAHRAGVVHRDLKPGNVMITRSGAKLMDFGLARFTPASTSAGSGNTGDLAHSPTVAHPLTAEGSILGTFQYMAPEQLEGQEADERADLWALGCVLYEMATAQRAFEGKTQASLIGSIMHTEPRPVAELAPMTPLELDRLVRACLRKDPTDRVQSAHDVKMQLEWMGEGLTSTSGISAAPRVRRAQRPRWIAPAIVAVLTALVTVAATVAALDGRRAQPAASTPLRLTVGEWDLRPQTTPLLSPDGSYVVLNIFDGASWQLYRRALDGHTIEPIPGTEEGYAPFFSPDGAWIGFVTPDAVKKIPARGGLAQIIAPVARINAGDWAPDDMIYLTPHAGSAGGAALLRVAATGGAVEVVAPLDPEKGENVTWLPEVLPDGKTVLVTLLGREGRSVVAIGPDGTRTHVLDQAFLARYVDSGHLLYVDQGSQAVLAVRFDPRTLRTSGAAVPLTDRVDGSFCFDVLDDGPLVYVPVPGAGAGLQLVWLDRKGAVTPVFEVLGSWAQPRISPSGKQIVFRKTGTLCELWLLDLERGSSGRLVQGNDNHDPVWSPDGSQIAFRRDDTGETMMLTVEGPRATTSIAQGGDQGYPGSWTANSDVMVYTVAGRGTAMDLWTRPMRGDGAGSVFLATAFDETTPDFSPDGRWIAFTSDQTGVDEVYVRAFPDTGAEWRVSNNGGSSPVWSRDGSELFFTSGRAMMAAPIEFQPRLSIGTPVTLFEGGFSTVRPRDFDVAPDGRFLSVGSVGGPADLDQVRIVLNWRTELERVAARH